MRNPAFVQQPLVFSRDRFDQIYPEIKPLSEEHYHEIAWRQDQISLDVDYEKYVQMNEMGAFVCFVARDGRQIVGYSFYFLANHPHYKQTFFAVNDVIFLKPAYRHRGYAKALIDYCDQELKALGCQVVTLHVKPALDFGPLCEALGYECGDRTWLKWLGG